MQKQYKAFTLVELMVAMAIIAVLIGMSVFGISVAQRSLRDNQRRDAVKNIAAALNDYYSGNSSYPGSLTSSATKTSITIGADVVPLAGILKSGSATDSTQTKYCYVYSSSSGNGYQLATVLEDGSIFNLGSSTTALTSACTAVN